MSDSSDRGAATDRNSVLLEAERAVREATRPFLTDRSTYVLNGPAGIVAAAVAAIRALKQEGVEAVLPSEALAYRLANLREMSDAIAEDEGLWFIAETAPEAYLQQELRKLCAAIEGVSPDDCARALLAKVKP